MTIGQRIAQKRKELGLSQEGLGEQLRVSRQAIYKWESDAALPEIEKLISLSRIFSVTVGWLLGVEEQSAPEQPGDGELTEAQLKMVEEIVDRYLAARPAPEPPPPPQRKKWPWVLGGCAAAVVLGLFVSLFSRLDQVAGNYNNLQWSISNIDSTVNHQIGSITSQVEEILKSQNHLTASYSSQLTGADLRANSVTFAVRAVPKTYVEGMTAVFLADCGDGPVEVPGALGAGHAFSAELTCPLTDSITLSVVFADGDKRETQVLDTYEYLWSGSFPEANIGGGLPSGISVSGGQSTLYREKVHVYTTPAGKADLGAGIAELQVGLFKDNALVCWYEPLPPEQADPDGSWPQVFRRPWEIALEQDHAYCEAVLITDEYGRQRVWADIPVVYDGDRWTWAAQWSASTDPADWGL